MKRDGHLVVESNGITGVVTLDGVELQRAIRGLKLTFDAGQLPTVVLDPMVLDANVLHSGWMDVRIPDATSDLLIALGWTPPAGES